MDDDKIINQEENLENSSQQVIEESKVLEDDFNKLQDSYKRLLAELVNTKKNIDLDNKKSKSSLLLKIISIIDTYSIVVAQSNDDGNEAWDALKNILQQLEILLATEGVKKLEIKEGDNFNPEIAEVVTTQKSEESGKILGVISYPYSLDDSIIKVGKVIVSKDES